MNNLAYIESLYRQWQENPSAVAQPWDEYFRRAVGSASDHPTPATTALTPDKAYRQSRVDSLLWAYRDIGYLYASLNPLGGDYGPDHNYLHRDGFDDLDSYERLTLDEFGISPEDLDTVFSAGRFMKPSPAPLRDIIAAFRQTYCGSIGVEFLHIQDKRIRRWLIEKMESTRNKPSLDVAQNRTILEDLLRKGGLKCGCGWIHRQHL